MVFGIERRSKTKKDETMKALLMKGLVVLAVNNIESCKGLGHIVAFCMLIIIDLYMLYTCNITIETPR